MTGSGSASDPFIIYDVTDLQNMKDNLAAFYELANDIDASATSGWNAGLGFAPVGSLATKFTGQLNGKGHTINALFINRTTDYNGLFGVIDTPAVIKNVGLTAVNITGDSNTAALVGYETGPTTISNNYSTGAIVGTSGGGSNTANGIGGLIGENQGDTSSISKCYSTCTVSGARQVGGLIGRSRCTVTNSYARGAVTSSNTSNGLGLETGGFIGEINGSVENCYSTGAVSSPGFGSPTQIGGFCGRILAPGTTTNCFWDTQTSGQAADGLDGTATGKTTAQMKTKSTFTDATWDFDTIWAILASVNDGYPYLSSSTLHHYLHVGGLHLPYEDLDETKELHMVLKNLSSSTKAAHPDPDGAVVVEIEYVPAA